MDENLSRQIDYWDRVATGDKQFSHPLDEDLFSRYVPRSASVLDYGCGRGRVLGRLASLGYGRLSGIDPSPAMLKYAGREYPSLNFRLLEKESLPFTPETFEAVLLFAVLTCVPVDSGQREIITGIRNVLRPGGILYLSDYLLQDDERNMERYASGEAVYGLRGVFALPDGVVLRHHSREWIENVLCEFEMLEWRDIEVRTMNGNRAKAFQCLARKPAE